MAVINDSEMLEVIIDDLEEQRGYNHVEAVKWAEEHGEAIVSAMWEEYTYYMTSNSTDKGEDDG